METSSPKLILGPIIGKVTSNTARISVELEFNREVECVLVSKKDDSKKTCRKVPNKSFPTIFAFSELDPETAYTVSLPQLTKEVSSSFRTLRQEGEQPGNFNIAVVSCNDITKTIDKPPIQDLWIDLSERVNNLDYLFHIGDQCYMDPGEGDDPNTTYEKCKRILSGLPKEKWVNYTNVILEILRGHQRLTWSHPPTASVLANVPNLMILDDHEVRDDWGWRKEDYGPNTDKCDYFYGQLARRVYYEYQRQLREDIDWENLDNLEQEYFYEILNGVGVAFLDYRGSRTWFREDKVEEFQLGRRQTEWVKKLFCHGGKFDQENVESVLFISPLPPVYVSGIFAEGAVFFDENDAQEQWSYNNSKELAHLLDILRDWKTRRFRRELTILGGDVHVGVETKIFYNKKPLFNQFTTSAISNVMTEKQKIAVRVALYLSSRLDSHYNYKHGRVMQTNNYGLVQMQSKHGVQTVRCTLVQSLEEGIRPEKKGMTNEDEVENANWVEI